MDLLRAVMVCELSFKIDKFLYFGLQNQRLVIF